MFFVSSNLTRVNLLTLNSAISANIIHTYIIHWHLPKKQQFQGLASVCKTILTNIFRFYIPSLSLFSINCWLPNGVCLLQPTCAKSATSVRTTDFAGLAKKRHVRQMHCAPRGGRAGKGNAAERICYVI